MKLRCLNVDDLYEDAKRIEQAVRIAGSPMFSSIYTTIYTDPLDKRIGSESFDIYILDIDMPGVNGFELSRQVERINPEAVMIFCSMHEDMVYESMRLHTFFFVRKSLLERDIKDCMEKYLVMRQNNIYVCKHKDKTEYAMVADIVYLEVIGNYLWIHLVNGKTLHERKSMKAILEEIAGVFLQVDRNYAVNVRYVQSLNGNRLVLKTNHHFDIPDKKLAKVRSRIIELLEK